jgi:hypothetical protein
VGTVCPVCEASPAALATHCPRCGFPTALYATLHGPVDLGPAPVADGLVEGAPPSLGSAPPTRSAVGPEATVNATIVQALVERVALLSTVDRDAPDVTGELCEAALNEAGGRVADAQQILRSAQGRLARETEELLGRHLADLEARGRTLQETGLRFPLEDQLAHIAENVVSGDVSAAVPGLLAAERRVGLIESHWHGLQALVAQVMTLRAEAEALGIEVGNACERLEAARASLATMPATEHDLDVTAQAAAEALMALHEAIPPALEAELARHQVALGSHEAPAPAATSARKLHDEVSQHLREGRLENAIASLRELRAELARLEREPAPVSPVPPPPAAEPLRAPAPEPVAPVEAGPPEGAAARGVPPPPPGRAAVSEAGAAPPPAPAPATAGPEVVAGLLRKARSLAARVRSLPPDSPEAASAAQEIHDATELLRAKRFAEADAALSRLMRTLTVPPARS